MSFRICMFCGRDLGITRPLAGGEPAYEIGTISAGQCSAAQCWVTVCASCDYHFDGSTANLEADGGAAGANAMSAQGHYWSFRDMPKDAMLSAFAVLLKGGGGGTTNCSAFFTQMWRVLSGGTGTAVT